MRRLVIAALFATVLAVPAATPAQDPPKTDAKPEKTVGEAPKEDKVKMDPETKAAVDKALKFLAKDQAADGSWTGSNWTGRFGQVYVTACFLTIMQLDNNCLPIYQR